MPEDRELWLTRFERIASMEVRLIAGACDGQVTLELGNLTALVPSGWTIRDAVRHCSRNFRTDAEWLSLSDDLDLPDNYFLAVHLVLQAGDWRKATFPAAYVRKSAIREARKIGLPATGGRERTVSSDAFDIAVKRLSFDGPFKSGRAWRAQPSEFIDASSYDEAGRPISAWSKRIPFHLLELGEDGRIVRWSRAFQLLSEAGVDEQMIEVLDLILFGLTRNEILKNALNETERLELQAAWRRLDRHWDKIQRIFDVPTKAIPSRPPPVVSNPRLGRGSATSLRWSVSGSAKPHP